VAASISAIAFFLCIEKKMAPRFKHGTEEYYRHMYPGMPNENIYPLLVVANANLDKPKKELKSILIRKCKHLASQSKEEVT
jgi:hypothetical protein